MISPINPLCFLGPCCVRDGFAFVVLPFLLFTDIKAPDTTRVCEAHPLPYGPPGADKEETRLSTIPCQYSTIMRCYKYMAPQSSHAGSLTNRPNTTRVLRSMVIDRVDPKPPSHMCLRQPRPPAGRA